MTTEYTYTPHQIGHFIKELEELEVAEIMEKGVTLLGRKVSVEELVRAYVKECGSMTSYARICRLAETHGVTPVPPLAYEVE